MARQIEMEVSIDTTKSEIKLQKLQNELKQLRKEAAQLDEGDKGFGAWAEAINQTENEMLQLKNSIKSNNVETSTSTKNFQSLGDRISSAFDGAGKKARRFTLALFSVRSAFSIISKASQSYLSQNEDTSNKIAGAWSYLGNVIGPVIEKIVSWLQYGIAYLNVFLKALTGVDFLAKSIQKSTAKLNKELKKTVSSMDEIVNLDLDSGSGGPNGAGALQDIADLELNPKVVEFMEKLGNAVKTVWEWAKTAWDFLEEHFGTTGALAIVAGLALIIGGAGKGLIGISGLLSSIATIGTIAIGVDLLYGALTGRDLIQDLKEINQGFKNLKEINELINNGVKKNTKAWNNSINTTNLVGVSTEKLTGLIDLLEKGSNSAAEAQDQLTDSMVESGSWYIDNREGISAYNDELKSNKQKLLDVKAQLQSNKKTLKEGTDEYKENEAALKKVDTALDNLDRKIVNSELNIELSSNAGTFRYNMYKLFDDIFNYWDNGIKRASGSGGKNSFGYGGGGGFRATGGKVENGQMFIANEAGPELVGNIGSTTAVLNNAQIVESVSQGVAMAVSSVMGSNNKGNQNATYLYINGSEFAKAVYDDMNTESRRRNANASIRRA